MKIDRPPIERLGKGQLIKTGSSVQHIVTGVSTLLKCGEIGEVHVTAAFRWYKDYVLGVVGARDPESQSSGSQPDIHAAMLARVDAIARCRHVRHSLGACAEHRLHLLLVDDLSFSAMAIDLNMDSVNGRKKVAAQMAFLLEQLAELYHSADTARRRRVA
jgi:hypothetical protein